MTLYTHSIYTAIYTWNNCYYVYVSIPFRMNKSTFWVIQKQKYLFSPSKSRAFWRNSICARHRTQLATHEPLLIPNITVKPCIMIAPCIQNGLKVKALRCKDFEGVAAACFYWRTSLELQDQGVRTYFPYKIKMKGGEFDKCKVRLAMSTHDTHTSKTWNDIKAMLSILYQLLVIADRS